MSKEESNLMSSTPLATWAASDSGTIDSLVDQMIIPSTLHETRLARTDLDRNMGASGHLAGDPPPPPNMDIWNLRTSNPDVPADCIPFLKLAQLLKDICQVVLKNIYTPTHMAPFDAIM